MFPVGITRHEDGGQRVGPLTDQECPECGFEHFWSTTEWYGEWRPSGAAVARCEGCGTRFELVARKADSE